MKELLLRPIIWLLDKVIDYYMRHNDLPSAERVSRLKIKILIKTKGV